MSPSRGEKEVDRLLALAAHFQDRFNREIVEGFGLCPWARPARLAGETAVVACAERSESDVRAAIADRLSALPEPVVLVQLVFPRVSLLARDWERFVSRLVQDSAFDVQRWAAAAFHPDFPVDLRKPGARVRALRKSPDPAIQFIARSTLPRERGVTFVSASTFDHAGWRREHARPAKNATDEVRAQNDRTLLGERSVELLAGIDALRAARRAAEP